MGAKTRLFILDGSQKIIDKLENVLYENPELDIVMSGTALNLKMANSMAKELKESDVFLVSASLPDANGIDMIANVRENFNPKAKFIITVGQNTRNMVDEALDRGADGYLEKPFSPRDLAEKIQEVMNKGFEEEGVEELDIFKVEESEEEELAFVKKKKEVMRDEEDEKENKSKQSDRQVVDIFSNLGNKSILQSLTSKLANDGDVPNKVITFTSPKSNGKSTLLLNVAASIKMNSEYNPKVILVDFNLVYPALGVKMNQSDMNSDKVIYDIFDLIDEIDEVDETYLEKCVAIHEPTGIHILNTSLRGIRDIAKVTDKKIMQVIMFLREHYDVVMIDTNGYIRDETTIVPLTLSDVNVVVIENELGNVFQTQRFIEIVQIIEKDWEKKILDKTMFVINRYREENKLSVENVKTVLFETNNTDVLIPIVIPEEPEAIKYSNFGRLLIDKPSPATTKIHELAMMLYPFYEDEDRAFVDKRNDGNKSLLSKFFGKK